MDSDTIKKGTLLRYSNHSGYHVIEYDHEEIDGNSSTMYGYWDGGNVLIKKEMFRFEGVLQSGWEIIK